MNGRVYDPKLGRMLSPDPVTQAPENGQNYNRYSYAYNNPLKYTDPSGYELELSDDNYDVGDDSGFSFEFTFGSVFPSPLRAAPGDNLVEGVHSGMGPWHYITIGDYPYVRSYWEREYIRKGTPAYLVTLAARTEIAAMNNSLTSSFTFGGLPTSGIPARFHDVISRGGVNIYANIAKAENMSFPDWWAMVETDGLWDYKNKLSGPKFDQKLLDDFGNYHFGIVAGAKGFSLEGALYGAGAYQIYRGGGSPTHMLIATILLKASYGGYSLPDAVARGMTKHGFTWGDNPGDSINILNGWDFYDAL